MKALALLLFLMTYGISWSFTQEDYNNLTPLQKTIIKDSFYIGKPYSLGHTLATLAIVETKAGTHTDTTKNRICGPHQISVHVALKQANSKGSPKKLCKEVEENSKLSAIMALANIQYWQAHSSSQRQMIWRYNRGWLKSKHDKEFIKRFDMVMKVLLRNKIEDLK